MPGFCFTDPGLFTGAITTLARMAPFLSAIELSMPQPAASFHETPLEDPAEDPPAPPLPCLTGNGARLIEKARQTRRHAEAYRDVVERYCEQMPGYLDRFHDAMRAFHRTADRLRGPSQHPERPKVSPAEKP